MPLLLNAEPSAVVSAITAGATSAAGEGMTAITSVLPIAMPLIGAGVVITLGIKYFKKVTGKA